MGLQHTVDKWTAQSRGSGRGGGVGGSGPEVPFLDFDFTLQRYRVNGSTVDPTNYLVEDLNWGPFDLVSNVNDEGLLVSPNIDGNSPSIDSTIVTDIAQGSFTMVLYFVPATDEVNHNGKVGVEFFQSPEFNSEWITSFNAENNIISAGSQSGITIADGEYYDEVLTGGFVVENTQNVAAVYYTSTSVGVCLNGDNPIGVVPPDTAVVRNAIGIYGECRLRALKIYKGHRMIADLVQLTG